MAKDNYTDALIYFDKALGIDANIDCYLFDKASCYLNLLEYESAYKTYEKAFKINPHSGGIANPDIFLDFIKDLESIDLIKD